MKKPIAIVGMACRFPGGVTSPDEFWALLRDAKDAVTQIPSDRFGTEFYQHPSKREPGKSYTFAAGVLDDIAGFDAAFFGISPREASQMDPQQRLLLELAWETFEDAGVRPSDMGGRNCAVYVGIASPDYGNRSLDDLSATDPYSATGTALSIASNRVSYVFDLRGPSMSIDTACSSSLVALHQACRALEAGDAELALAGGVNLLMHPSAFVGFSKASMLSPGGRCRAFDAGGDGYVRSEGGAMVLLKPLDQAVADGDAIHAVIVGSGVNSDGYSAGGISVPTAAAQAALLRSVYARADIDPRSLAYLEAHGTGTAVGDPIEARAIIAAAAAGRTADTPLLIGSAKTNVGHLETASGMVGLLKTVLALKHRAVPASLHFETPNPRIDFSGGNLRVVDRFTSLDARDSSGARPAPPLLMAVNSFGFGGTNAHVVLQEAPRMERDEGQSEAGETAWLPLMLSARSPAALSGLAARYRHALDSGQTWNALAASAAHARQWLPERAVLAPTSMAEANDALAALSSRTGETLQPALVLGTAPGDDARLALVFSGNGSQWVGMGRRLIDEDPVFGAALEEVDVLWRAEGGESLVNVIRAGASAERLSATEHSQPLLFAIQVALTRVIETRGILFDACVGHSVGEVAAAWAAGALTLAQAVRVVKVRSHAQGLTRGRGRMAAAGIGEAAMQALLVKLGVTAELEIAGINSPSAVTIAGGVVALRKVEASLQDTGVFFRMLDLDYPFHSSHMEDIRGVVRDGLAALAPRDGSRRFISTVSGGELAGSALDGEYWWRNIREPVQFGAAVEHLAVEGVRIFLEVGPHPILRAYIKQAFELMKLPVRVLPTLQRGQDSVVALRHSVLGALAHGARADLDVFAPPLRRAGRIALPAYPWQREHFWQVPTTEAYSLIDRRREHPLLGYRLHEHALAWENQLDPLELPMLADHVVDGGVAFAGAGYVEMALAAAQCHFGATRCAVENLEIRVPVVFEPSQAKSFRLIVDTRTATFTIDTRDRLRDEAWTINVTGRLLASGPDLATRDSVTHEVLDRLMARPALPGELLYASAASVGLAYGPAFRWVRTVYIAGSNLALAELDIPEVLTQGAAQLDDYVLHPALIDSAFHPLFALLARGDAEAAADRVAYVPVQLGRIDYLRSTAVKYVVARIDRRSPHSLLASFELLDDSRKTVARLSACRFRRIDLLGRRRSEPEGYTFLLEAKPRAGDIDAHALPAPAALISRAAAKLEARASAQDAARSASHLSNVLPLLDVLASAYALRALDQSNVFDKALLPDSAHPALQARLADMLVEDGLASWEGLRLLRNDTACQSLPDLAELWRDLLSRSPAHVAELTLLAHCGAALPEVLRGELTGEQVLPVARSSLVEHFFEASPTWRYVNALTLACAEAALDAWEQPRRMRVLEIASPDTEILQPLGLQLPESRCDHTIAGSQEQISGFDAKGMLTPKTAILEYGTLPALVGPAAGEKFDLLISSRTLGSQFDQRAMLRAMRDWLAPGALVVIAQAQRSRFSDIVFNLTTQIAAPGAPTLSVDDLMRLLAEAGFEQISQRRESDLDPEGVPSFVVARNTAAAAAAADAADAADGPNIAEREAPVRSCPHWTLLHSNSDIDSAFARVLMDQLTAVECNASAVRIADALEDPSLLEDPSGSQPVAHGRRLIFIAPQSALPVNATGVDILRAQQHGSIALAHLVRTLSTSAELTIVTRGGAPFSTPYASGADLHPEQATLWGLARVLANEHPELRCRVIDLDRRISNPAEALALELLAGEPEEEVLLTQDGRYVPRMVSTITAGLRGASALSLHEHEHEPAQATVLAFEAPGSLRNLEWIKLPERELRADEVEIEPVATGLNFRDVMYAMGLLSDEAVENGFAGATVGMELAGRITQVGSRVTNLAVGDAVLGFAPASFATRVQTLATALTHKPETMSYEEAATIPAAFFTAYYALCELGRVRRGERVLVHGGAGAVGIAAIQLARYLGAEVFATAGSREKREFVRMAGASHVLDSRSLAFADEILALTQGVGVDVVLNSLAGEAMVRGIDTLRPFGRFLELGKRDFYENNRIGLRPFRNNISYFGIDVDQLMSARPDLTTRLFTEVMDLFAQGVLHPLPYRAFAAARVEEAFRYMQQARQIGKILITYPSGKPAVTRAMKPLATLQLDASAAYLIAGGTSGLGFATARWMVSRGARHLTLVSRTGVLSQELADESARWEGVTLSVQACNVTDTAAVQALIADVADRGTPLKGVVHSAMVIDDGLVCNLDDARFEAVLAPKLAGAWNLHCATRGAPLDFFVVYSSATTFLGNAGQSSYVAANSFLEALVEQRRAAGLAGTYMAWGPIDDVGFLARHAGTREQLQARMGGASISSGEAMAALEQTLIHARTGEAVLRLDWNAIARIMPAAKACRYAGLQSLGERQAGGDNTVQLEKQIRALPYDDALQLATKTLQAQLARILHSSPDQIAIDRSVVDMGMDSLMGMELGMVVEEAFEVKLSVMALAEGVTIGKLAARIVESINAKEGGNALHAPATTDQEFAVLAARHALDDSIAPATAAAAMAKRRSAV